MKTQTRILGKRMILHKKDRVRFPLRSHRKGYKSRTVSDIIVSEFEPHYIHFGLLYPLPTYGLNSTTRMALASNDPLKLICHSGIVQLAAKSLSTNKCEKSPLW